MLSNEAVNLLKPLRFRSDAKRLDCPFPIGGILWEDELPDRDKLNSLPREERDRIFRLFGIRIKIWDVEKPTQQEQALWDAARARLPDHPLFQRLQISDEDRQAQTRVENWVLDFFTAAQERSGKLHISKGDEGVHQFAVTMDLAKRHVRKFSFANIRRWWKNIWHGDSHSQAATHRPPNKT